MANTWYQGQRKEQGHGHSLANKMPPHWKSSAPRPAETHTEATCRRGSHWTGLCHRPSALRTPDTCKCTIVVTRHTTRHRHWDTCNSSSTCTTHSTHRDSTPYSPTQPPSAAWGESATARRPHRTGTGTVQLGIVCSVPAHRRLGGCGRTTRPPGTTAAAAAMEEAPTHPQRGTRDGRPQHPHHRTPGPARFQCAP